MDANQFVNEVQAEADLPDHGTAERATLATLQTLSERIVGDEVIDLVSQLPTGLADALRTDAVAESFGLEEFVARVAQRAEIDEPHALRVAQAVMATTAHAVTSGEFSDVLAQLPNDYEPLVSLAGGFPDRHT